MNPKGFDFTCFNYPIHYFFDFKWLASVRSVDYNNTLTIKEEAALCNYNDFTHVYYFTTTINKSSWDQGDWMYLVKHKSGYYVYLRARYSPNFYNFDDGSIYYSKSWASMWNDILLEEERKKIMALLWYKSCEKTRAAIIALHGCRRRRQDVRNRCPRDVWQVIVAMVWEERFNND